MNTKDYIKTRYIFIALWIIIFLFNLITVIWATASALNWILMGLALGIILQLLLDTPIIKLQDGLIKTQNNFIDDLIEIKKKKK